MRPQRVGQADLRLLDIRSAFTPAEVERTDVELVQAAREGESEAYAALYRRHFGAMLGFAWQYSSSREQAEDLASEAFANVLSALHDGKGPNLAVRAYMLTTVRNAATQRARDTKRVTTTDDDSVLDREQPPVDLAEREFEHSSVARAFASLPERWQQVLWYLDVEGAAPSVAAIALGLKPNSVSSLGHRARIGLRKAFVVQQVLQHAKPECKPFLVDLVEFAEGGLGKLQRRRVKQHLDTCDSCTAAMVEVEDMRERIGLAVPLGFGALGSFVLVAAIAAKDALLPPSAFAAALALSGGGASVSTAASVSSVSSVASPSAAPAAGGVGASAGSGGGAGAAASTAAGAGTAGAGQAVGIGAAIGVASTVGAASAASGLGVGGILALAATAVVVAGGSVVGIVAAVTSNDRDQAQVQAHGALDQYGAANDAGTDGEPAVGLVPPSPSSSPEASPSSVPDLSTPVDPGVPIAVGAAPDVAAARAAVEPAAVDVPPAAAPTVPVAPVPPAKPPVPPTVQPVPPVVSSAPVPPIVAEPKEPAGPTEPVDAQPDPPSNGPSAAPGPTSSTSAPPSDDPTEPTEPAGPTEPAPTQSADPTPTPTPTAAPSQPADPTPTPEPMPTGPSGAAHIQLGPLSHAQVWKSGFGSTFMLRFSGTGVTSASELTATYEIVSDDPEVAKTLSLEYSKISPITQWIRPPQRLQTVTVHYNGTLSKDQFAKATAVIRVTLGSDTDPWMAELDIPIKFGW